MGGLTFLPGHCGVSFDWLVVRVVRSRLPMHSSAGLIRFHCGVSFDWVVGRVVRSRLPVQISAGLNPFSSGVALQARSASYGLPDFVRRF